MKLFTRYSRINVLATIIIFLIASAAFYFTLNYVLMQQIDDDLIIEEKEISTYSVKYNRLPESISVKDQIIHYEPSDTPLKRQFITRTLTDKEEKNKEKFRELQFGIQAAGQWHKVSVSKSLEDMDDLRRVILTITSATILAILIASFVINRVVLKRIWKPFYRSLGVVKDFKISGNQELQLPQADIDEFLFMNRTLERITRKAQLDYLSLKTFSENASHEIQTPIAIVRSKLDLLIQNENLTEEQSHALQSAYNAIQKLTRLNQSLLLLARIENNQFEEIKEVDLKKRLGEKMADFQELWQARQIAVQGTLHHSVIHMNADLADILLNNLLSNATRHNFEGGQIFIELGNGHLSVRNTSHSPSLDKEQIFHRFYKPFQSNEHNGLGLSIIKQICAESGFNISYSYSGLHDFQVSWPR